MPVLNLTNRAALAAADAIVDLTDDGTTNSGGKIRIYSGTIPTDADTAIGAQVLLAEVDLQDPAFGAATDAAPGGQAALLGVTLSDLAIDATGTAAWFRMVDRDEATVLDGDVTATGGGGLLQVNTVSFVASARFDITALTFTMPES